MRAGLVILLMLTACRHEAAAPRQLDPGLLARVGWWPTPLEEVRCDLPDQLHGRLGVQAVTEGLGWHQDIDCQAQLQEATRMVCSTGGDDDRRRVTVLYGSFDPTTLETCAAARWGYLVGAGGEYLLRLQDPEVQEGVPAPIEQLAELDAVLATWASARRRLADDPILRAWLAYVPPGRGFRLRLGDHTTDQLGYASRGVLEVHATVVPAHDWDEPEVDLLVEEYADEATATQVRDLRTRMARWEPRSLQQVSGGGRLVVRELVQRPRRRVEPPPPAASEPQDGTLTEKDQLTLGALPARATVVTCGPAKLEDTWLGEASGRPGCVELAGQVQTVCTLFDVDGEGLLRAYLGSFEAPALARCAPELATIWRDEKVLSEGWRSEYWASPTGHVLLASQTSAPDQGLSRWLGGPTLGQQPRTRRILARVVGESRGFSVFLGDNTGPELGVASVSTIVTEEHTDIEFSSVADAEAAARELARRNRGQPPSAMVRVGPHLRIAPPFKAP